MNWITVALARWAHTHLGLRWQANDARSPHDPEGLVAHGAGREGARVGGDSRTVEEAGAIQVNQLHQDFVREGRALCLEVPDSSIWDGGGRDLVPRVNHSRSCGRGGDEVLSLSEGCPNWSGVLMGVLTRELC